MKFLNYKGKTYNPRDTFLVVEGKQYRNGAAMRDETFKTVLSNDWELVDTKPKSKSRSEIEKRIEDYKEDLEDDGKRNYSNDPSKKSPGKKKKNIGEE